MELCRLCGVSRSGYYRWKARGGRPPEDRARILRLVKDCHESHPSHGYRWVHAYLVRTEGIEVSANYIYKCFSYLGITSKTKHRQKGQDRRQKRRLAYPNLIFSTWSSVDRPRQVIVSDMTAFWTRYHYYELVFYFDVFTKQIIGHGITKKRGFPGIYYEGLDSALGVLEQTKRSAVACLEEGSGEICVLHTDQGSVYTSKAYNEIIKDANIVRSCSRAGKPTDNPVNESLNGWIKEELFLDFGLYDKQDWEVEGTIEQYVAWYNAHRPSWSLGYKTPDEYYEAYLEGSIERTATLGTRVVEPTPKFLCEKLTIAEEAARRGGIGTSDAALR